MNKYFLILLLFVLLSACEEQKNLRELREYVDKTRENLSVNSKKQESSVFQLPEAVSYQSSGSFSNVNGSNNDSNATAIQNPLSAYSIKSYQFTGTLTEGNITWAYILAPDNEIYQVKEGDILGNSYGKISKIVSDHVDIIEKGMDAKKKPVERIVVLQLKE